MTEGCLGTAFSWPEDSRAFKRYSRWTLYAPNSAAQHGVPVAASLDSDGTSNQLLTSTHLFLVRTETIRVSVPSRRPPSSIDMLQSLNSTFVLGVKLPFVTLAVTLVELQRYHSTAHRFSTLLVAVARLACFVANGLHQQQPQLLSLDDRTQMDAWRPMFCAAATLIWLDGVPPQRQHTSTMTHRSAAHHRRSVATASPHSNDTHLHHRRHASSSEGVMLIPDRSKGCQDL